MRNGRKLLLHWNEEGEELLLPAILFGKDRYVQINALRNDTASMELLGLRKIVSEDTVFDEFKNQWGRSGFTTKRLKPCKAMARLVAIVANLWNVFVRRA